MRPWMPKKAKDSSTTDMQNPNPNPNTNPNSNPNPNPNVNVNVSVNVPECATDTHCLIASACQDDDAHPAVVSQSPSLAA